MVDDHSDILGGHLQKAPPAPYKAWIAANPTTTAALAVVFSLLSYFILIPAFNRWQDRRYRKALRRRYGIPDDDQRPFAIAYAAARARTDEGSDDGNREASEQPEDGRPPTRRGHSGTPMLVRRRVDGEDAAPLHEPEVPRSATHAPYVSQYDPSQVVYNAWQTGPSATPVGDAVTRDHVQMPPQRPQTSLFTALSEDSRRRASPPTLRTHGKHARDDDETGQPEKKSRLVDATPQVDEGVFIDGEEVRDNMDVDVEVSGPKRGAKRQANADEDEGIEHVLESGRDKRARKVSREQAPEHSDEEMVAAPAESEDEVTELVPLQRGKKRDRDEAGSTFGGDESVLDEAESDDGRKSRRRRKRRTMAKNVQDAARGQKRSRDDASEESDEEPDRPKRRDTRGQRGNRDLDVFDAPLSNDPLCKGRRIGEEWEVNGIHFKVGPNGQRLRQELVKRSRTRFPMPKDSAHPDRRANINVYVEAWLTDEEYQLAKEHGDLAWQDSPVPSTPATPGDVSDFSSGKSLLWAASSTPESPAPQRGPFRQSIVTNVGLRFDPFGQSQLPPRRRVTSLTQAAQPVATSPEPSPQKPAVTKTYSKWEKQDLEAAAMTKLRERRLAEAREANRTATPTPPPPQITFQPAAPAPTPTPSTAAPAAPSTTFPKPAEQKAEKTTQATGDNSASSFSFGAPPATAATTSSSGATPTTAPAPTKEPSKNFFSFAPSPNPSATAATPSAQPASSSSIPNFFGNAGKTTATASAQPQGNSQPQAAPTAPAPSAFNFGTKPASAVPSSGSTPSANPFGGAGGSVQSAADSRASSAPKSAFSFAPSATSSTPTSTTAPAEKPAAQPANATTGATPSLLARLGPQVQNSPTTQQQTNHNAAGHTNTGSPLKFSFTQPSATTASGSTLQSAFAQPSDPASAAPASKASASTPATSSNTDSAKFSFGFTGPAQSASSTPSAAPASSTPAASSAPSASGAANQGSAFSFNFGAKPSTPAGQTSGNAPKPFGGFNMPGQATTSTSAPAAKTPAAFGFGAPSSTTPAGSSAFGGSSTANNTSTTTPSKPAGFSAFSTTPAGAPSNTNAFGGNTTNSSSAAAPKSAFSFGVTGGASAFGSAGASSTQSSAPSPFGAAAGSTAQTTANSTQGQSKPSFSFNFGATPAASSTTTSNAPTTQPGAAPVFGATSQPASNPFNFSSTSSSAPSAFNFGAASSTNQNQKQ